MKKLLLTNLIYGTDPYLEIFLNQHLKSMLDETNIPAHKDSIAQYVIYTDVLTAPMLSSHPRVLELRRHIDVEIGIFSWPPDITEGEKFKGRYAAIVNAFHMSVEKAISMDAICSMMVADLVVAKEYIGKLLSRFQSGYNSVFVLPIRTAYEALAPILDEQPNAVSAYELGQLAVSNLHPLWVHSIWENPLFTKQPFSLVWPSDKGLVVHSFAITPIAFIPKKEMLNTREVIDVEVPNMCDGPTFWATDWVDCPILGLEPAQCYYPPFGYGHVDRNNLRKIDDIVNWTECLYPNQLPYLRRALFYPSFKDLNLLSDPGHEVTEEIILKAEARKELQILEAK